VQTILPDENIKAVVLGSRILIITAANRFGLYSAFRACNAIFFKSNFTHKLTVDTMFCNWGTGIESEAGVAGMIAGMLLFGPWTEGTEEC
jgi:hypothetical protein